MNNHLRRILTALIGIPIVILLCLVGGIYFFLFVALISSLSLIEFYKLIEAKGAKPLIVLGVLSGLLINLSFFHVKLRDFVVNLSDSVGLTIPFPTQTQLFLIIMIVVLIVLFLTELFRNNGSALLNLSTTLFGILYVSLFFGTLIGLRELFVPYDFPVSRYFPYEQTLTDVSINQKIYHWGGLTVISLFAMIWICDTAAFYVGSLIGRHKLFPRVSPNKSWEGAIAGFIFAVLTAIAVKYIFLEYLSLNSAIIIGVIVGVFGQAGDLIESLFKRDAGVKDSSSLLPGHGGVYDRFDSLLLVSPLVYLYLDYILFS